MKSGCCVGSGVGTWDEGVSILLDSVLLHRAEVGPVTIYHVIHPVEGKLFLRLCPFSGSGIMRSTHGKNERAMDSVDQMLSKLADSIPDNLNLVDSEEVRQRFFA